MWLARVADLTPLPLPLRIAAFARKRAAPLVLRVGFGAGLLLGFFGTGCGGSESGTTAFDDFASSIMGDGESDATDESEGRGDGQDGGEGEGAGEEAESERKYGSDRDRVLVETRHMVEVEIEGTLGRFFVRHEYVVRRDSDEPLSTTLKLPAGATLGRFRVLVNGVELSTTLEEGERANDVLERLVRRPGSRPASSTTDLHLDEWDAMPVALARWGGSGAVDVEFGPSRRGDVVEMTYESIAPSCAHRGHLVFEYPRDEDADALSWDGSARVRARGLSNATVFDVIPTSRADSDATDHRGDTDDSTAPLGLADSDDASGLGGSRASPGAEPSQDDGSFSEEAYATWRGTTSECEFVDAPEPIVIAYESSGTTLRAEYGKISFDEGDLARLTLEAPQEFEAVPPRLRVVFVLDASFSTEDEGLGRQLDVVRSYLANVPAAEFEIVTFARRSRRLLGRFAAATEIDAALASVPPEVRSLSNGSNLSSGLLLAVEALQDRREALPPEARVVVITDALLPRSFEPTPMLRRLEASSDRLRPRVHAVELQASEDVRPMLEVSQETSSSFSFLAGLTRSLGGEVYTLFGDTRWATDLKRETEELVHPIWLHDPVLVPVDASDLATDDLDAPEVGLEGLEGRGLGAVDLLALDLPRRLGARQGHRAFVFARGAPEALTLRGLVWGRVTEWRVERTPVLESVMPALAFGSDVESSLPNDVARSLSERADVVSPYRSFVAYGARTRTVGPATAGLGLFGTCGCGGMIGTFSSRCGLARASANDLTPKLRSAIEGAVLACGVHRVGANFAMADLVVDLETTRGEIADVRVIADDASLGACVEDAIFGVRLSAEFRGHSAILELHFSKP